jgi:hypothetical protein
MIHMKQLVAVFAATGLIIGSAAASAQPEPTKGSNVMLTSCVEKGQKADTFVLTHVADVPAHPATHGGRVVYWLDRDTAKKLRDHVGHQIRVSGKVADVDQREMEITDTDQGLMVEIEGPGQDVRTTPNNAGVSPTAAMAKLDQRTTLVKLKDVKVDMVAAKCMLATTK